MSLFIIFIYLGAAEFGWGPLNLYCYTFLHLRANADACAGACVGASAGVNNNDDDKNVIICRLGVVNSKRQLPMNAYIELI